MPSKSIGKKFRGFDIFHAEDEVFQLTQEMSRIEFEESEIKKELRHCREMYAELLSRRTLLNKKLGYATRWNKKQKGNEN